MPYVLGGSTIGNDLRVGDMGTDAAHEEVFWRIPAQVGPQVDGEATVEGTGQRMGLPPM